MPRQRGTFPILVRATLALAVAGTLAAVLIPMMVPPRDGTGPQQRYVSTDPNPPFNPAEPFEVVAPQHRYVSTDPKPPEPSTSQTIRVPLSELSATVTQTTATVTLQDAIRDGLVAATFTGLGGSSGDAVKVQVRRLRNAGDRRLALRVPPGSLLRSASAAVQNMIVMEVRGRDAGNSKYAPASEIVVSDDKPVTYILSAMCADFDKENPSEQTTFSLVEPQDLVLVCVARKGGGDRPVPASQAAVWMHTDKVSYSEMNERFPVSPAEWAVGEEILRSCVFAR